MRPSISRNPNLGPFWNGAPIHRVGNNDSMHIEATKQKIAKSGREVYEFLTDVKNFESLMPESIEKFELLDDETFKFALKGMPEIVLRLKDREPHKRVSLGAASDKLPFTLTADIEALSENESEVALSFEGQLNAMNANMVKSPIPKFKVNPSPNFGKQAQKRRSSSLRPISRTRPFSGSDRSFPCSPTPRWIPIKVWPSA